MSRPGRIPGGPARKTSVKAPRKKTATAAAPNPPNIGEYLVQSAGLYRMGRVRDALDIVIQGLAIDPDNADLLNHRGVFAARLGDVAAAEAAYRRAIETRPDGAEIHYNLGNLLKAQDRSQEAAVAYQRAIALKPDYPEAWANLGNLLQAQGRPQEAEAAYHRAIELQPNHADTYSNLGNLLQAQQRPDEAEAAYRRAVALRPDYPEALSNLGVLLKARQRPQEAEAAYRRAIALKPDYAEAWSNLGVLLLEQKRMQEAETACRRATEAKPDYADAWSNLGNLLQEQKRLQEAEAAYRRALALRPRNADARWNLSLLLLREGRFSEGWREHEARYDPLRKNRKMAPPPTLRDGPPLPPQWQGESLTDRSLLIWPEQGLGDEIQFVRYLPLLKARGPKHLTLVCKPPLKRLFAAQSLADSVIDTDDWRPEMIAGYDYWCYPLSLPLHFGTTPEHIPATIPYLVAEPERMARWAMRLPQARFRVGLVWKGNPTHRNDANRSLPSLATLAPLWSLPGIAFVSLQKGAGEDEAGAPPITQPLFHPGSEMADFADSAAILGQLDLLICVDTAVAHLAGALGIPCWVLLPACGTDWRWLEDRTDSPWYPELMRLFRQTADGDWGGVMAQLVDALGEWTKSAERGEPALPRTEMSSVASRAASGWQHFGGNTDLQTPFDVAVIMPTVGRDCILDAVRAVYAQQDVGRIQLLIGVDVPRGDFTRLHELLEATPAHVTPCLFHPGYSTSRRHGGLHPAFDGGVLRTVLSYLANARYLAYLDDDNWWAPTHLSSLLSAVQGRNWAFALRWFVHPESRQPVCVDEWESVGPGRGDFLKKFGGWVDPNCLLIDKLACEPALRWWSIPLPGGSGSMAADRHVYHWLQKHGPPGETGSASTYYLMQAQDILHPRRLDRMGARYAAAGPANGHSPPDAHASA
ncbi:MAG: tetratricopeptide repeat-containing glycosyltransferase family protein [Sulfuritalea sp.]|nr:tetratricopeptide repeat-containing glycosyltransferase family protein [Sulfuritalea sp.]MDP1983927.1 tetratricopeptide repeat-containing glycosyltransferase family protein [Sulfuritalea sp.]